MKDREAPVQVLEEDIASNAQAMWVDNASFLGDDTQIASPITTPIDEAASHNGKGALPRASDIHRTPFMRETEERIGEPLCIFLDRAYNDERQSSALIASTLGVGTTAVNNWLHNCNIKVRLPSESSRIAWEEGRITTHPSFLERTRDFEEKRIAAVRRMWQERKDEMIAKIHTSDSARKRSESLKKRLEDPEARRIDEERIARVRQTLAENAKKRREAAFGEDVAQRLYNLHHIEGLTIEDIAARSGFSSSYIEGLMRENNITITIKTNEATVAKFQEVQERLWSHPNSFLWMTRKQQEVIYRRFIADGSIPSMEEVGEAMGTSRQDIHQTETLAIKRLRKVPLRK